MQQKPQVYSAKATREAVNIYYVYHFPIFVFLIQVTGLVFLAMIFTIIKLYLKDFQYTIDEEEAEKTRNVHLFLAPLGFVFLNGEGILVFRICRNIKTWQVKLFHILIHFISILIGSYAVFAMYLGKEYAENSKTEAQIAREAEENNTGYSCIEAVNRNHIDTLHPALGYFSVTCTSVSIISGAILVSMSPNDILVDFVSELHGFLGVFTLIATSITTVCGIMTKMNDEYYFEMDKYYAFTDEYKLAFGAISCSLIFTWGIIYVVINPHFEWVKIETM